VKTDPERDKGRGSKRHSHEKLDLVMKQAAIIENAYYQEQSGARQDAENLTSRLTLESEHDCNDCATVDGKATEQRHGTLMQFTRVGLVNHSQVEGQAPHRSRQAKGSGQSDSKDEHSGLHIHLEVKLTVKSRQFTVKSQVQGDMFPKVSGSLPIRRGEPP
jgi:hypothetical protein